MTAGYEAEANMGASYALVMLDVVSLMRCYPGNMCI